MTPEEIEEREKLVKELRQHNLRQLRQMVEDSKKRRRQRDRFEKYVPVEYVPWLVVGFLTCIWSAVLIILALKA